MGNANSHGVNVRPAFSYCRSMNRCTTEEEVRPSYSTIRAVNPFPRLTSSLAGIVYRCSRSQASDRRPLRYWTAYAAAHIDTRAQSTAGSSLEIADLFLFWPFASFGTNDEQVMALDDSAHRYYGVAEVYYSQFCAGFGRYSSVLP